MTLLQATATCLEIMTLIMTDIRPEMRRETPGEARKETRRETRTTETMSGAHGTMSTLQSHESAVTSLQIENHPEDSIHAPETPLQTPNIDLHEASHLVTAIVIVTATGTVTGIGTETGTATALIDPAAPQLMQATMRGIDDVQAIARNLAKQTTAMIEGATKIGGATKTEVVTETDIVTKTEVVTKTDTVTGIVHLLTAAT